MLPQVLSQRSYRICLLGGIGIVTILGILISFNTTLAYSSRASVYDSSRKDLKDSYVLPTKSSPTPTGVPNSPNRDTYKSSTCRSSAWGPEWTVDSNGGVCRHGEIGLNGCCISTSSVDSQHTDERLSPRPTDTLRIPLSTTEVESEAGSPGASKSTENRSDENDSPIVTTNKAELSSNTDKKAPLTVAKPTCSTEHQCCAQYEFCVSSCLDFMWERLHSTVVRAKASHSKEFDSVERLVGENQVGDDGVAKEFISMEIFDWCLARCRTSGRSVVHQNSFRSSLKHCYGAKDPPLLARNIEKGESL